MYIGITVTQYIDTHNRVKLEELNTNIIYKITVQG